MDDSSTSRSLDYASKGLGPANRRPPRLIAVGIISICVSLLSLIVNSGYVFGTYLVMVDAAYELETRQQEANIGAASMGFPTPVTLPQNTVRPLKDQRIWASLALFVFVIDYIPALLLLLASVLLLRSHWQGIKLHKLYAIVKLITNTAGGVVILLHFRAPIEFAGIPILLALIYPIVLLCIMRNLGPP